MQTNAKLYSTQLMRLFYEGSVLLFFVLGLVITVALGAYALEQFSSALHWIW
ncbi:MAG: hypothetical protein KDI83_18010 [Gammaproteobacteria bacterium]|nr:hypothetical protein [Gammaproteobacteria bacterium]